jgi:hypothetical protein
VAMTVEEPQKERTPRLVWVGLRRRAFALDVFTCVRCGAAGEAGPGAGATPKRSEGLPQAGGEERSVRPPQVAAEEASVAPEAGARKERTPPVDWAGLLRRTFAVDVFA